MSAGGGGELKARRRRPTNIPADPRSLCLVRRSLDSLIKTIGYEVTRKSPLWSLQRVPCRRRRNAFVLCRVGIEALCTNMRAAHQASPIRRTRRCWDRSAVVVAAVVSPGAPLPPSTFTGPPGRLADCDAGGAGAPLSRPDRTKASYRAPLCCVVIRGGCAENRASLSSRRKRIRLYVKSSAREAGIVALGVWTGVWTISRCSTPALLTWVASRKL